MPLGHRATLAALRAHNPYNGLVCVILFSYSTDERFRLAVAANRDEHHDRPASPLGFWHDARSIIAGRDLLAGGTWLGVTRGGRFAAITNYREPGNPPLDGAPSRGMLTSDFLRSTDPALAYLETLHQDGTRYSGFSLLVFDGADLAFYSNRGPAPQRLGAGLYGLSNHLLDTPWPKVHRGRERLGEILASGGDPVPGFFDILADRSFAAGEELPRTGLTIEEERALSPLFITSLRYGTRSSTVVLIGAKEIEIHERTFSADAVLNGSRSYRIDIESGE